ncbi:Kinase A inhibitor [compost metagenome]
MEARFLCAGDTALVVEFGDVIDRALSEQVLQFGARVRAHRVQGVLEVMPTFRSLMVHYDPLSTSGEELTARLRALMDGVAAAVQPVKLWTIPACYEEAHAPDLADVARQTGMDVEEVVRLHSRTRFHVYMVGFVPGYPYMGDLPAQLVLPRRANPRIRVPAGSIAIATTMTAIYPLESPGGWHLIGATPVRLFDASKDRPALFQPGDQVRFEPVGAADFDAIRAAAEAGHYQVPCEEVKE